MYEKIINKTK